ncbi:MAG: cellulose binding domain-containing protein, partial [Duganella sp.]
VTSSWSGGYNAAIRITNNRSTTINGWTLSWTYTDNSVVNTHWNANVTGNSPTYTATPSESWSQNIAPGSSVEFGITVSGAAIPTVTGAACQ